MFFIDLNLFLNKLYFNSFINYIKLYIHLPKKFNIKCYLKHNFK